MKKLNETYQEKIGNKERNKIKINERVGMIKEEKRRNNYFYNFATVLGLIVILVAGYFHFNQTDSFKEEENNNSNLKEIIIEGTTYYNYYDMGVNMLKVPESPIYGYAIREDNNSYKIVSLHRDGTNFDLVAVDDKLQDISNDGANLAEHYKLTIVDNKLYFIRIAYSSAETKGEDNSNIITGKNQKYDLEVYYVDINDEHPKLELLLQKGDQNGIYYDVKGIMINNSNLYYYNQYSDNGTIEALKLGDIYHENHNIKLPEKIRGYHINDNVLYVYFGNLEEKYAIVDFYYKDSNGYNLTTLITEDEYNNQYDYNKVITSNALIHYFNIYNRYTKLWANDKEVKLEGFESSEKGIGFIGNKLLVDNKEVYNYDSTNDRGITLLSTVGSKINFCIGIGSYCDIKDDYYSYNIETEELEKNSDIFNYLLLIYVLE